jgi:hypothetical protein
VEVPPFASSLGLMKLASSNIGSSILSKGAGGGLLKRRLPSTIVALAK